ncbi:MAG: FMN-binding protein [Clostridia bacterium]
MKKYLGILAIVLLVAVLFAGCTEEPAVEDPGTDDPGTEEPTTTYVDGTWEGHSITDPTGDNASVGVATITVVGGEITEADYYEHQVGKATAKDESYNWPQYFEAIESISDQIVETQDPESIDVISEATSTSNKFIEAINIAIENSTTTNTFYNGTYFAKAEPDDHGYYAVAYVTFEDDEVTNVLYEERSEEDDEAKVEGEYGHDEYFEAVEELSQQIMDTQDVEELDVIAEATSTSEKFADLMEDIFAQASVE